MRYRWRRWRFRQRSRVGWIVVPTGSVIVASGLWRNTGGVMVVETRQAEWF